MSVRLPWFVRACHTRHWLCEHGVHRVTWDEAAVPAYLGDPPLPPEPGYSCEWCGEVRDPYRAAWWGFKARVLEPFWEWRYDRERLP